MAGDAFLVQEGDAGLHVFQAVAGDCGQIERAESGAGLFLAIADQHAQKVLDIEAGPRALLNQDGVAVAVRAWHKAQTARAVLGVDIPLPDIERLHEVTVGVNNPCHTAYPWLGVRDW